MFRKISAPWNSGSRSREDVVPAQPTEPQPHLLLIDAGWVAEASVALCADMHRPAAKVQCIRGYVRKDADAG